MARTWWSSNPTNYFSKPIARGGRNEIIFSIIGKKIVKID